MVDEGKIAFTIAVELSYLKEDEQYELHAVMDLEQCTPSLSQANRIKRLSQSEGIDMDKMYDILGAEKAIGMKNRQVFIIVQLKERKNHDRNRRLENKVMGRNRKKHCVVKENSQKKQRNREQ